MASHCQFGVLRGYRVTAAYKGSAVCFYPFASLALCAPFLRILSKAVLSTGINVTRDIYSANETSQISRWCSFKIPPPSLFLQHSRFPASVPFPLHSHSLLLSLSLSLSRSLFIGVNHSEPLLTFQPGGRLGKRAQISASFSTVAVS